MAGENKTAACTCVLRFFGANRGEIERAAAALPGVSAKCMSRGGETLAALSAADKAALEKAAGRLRGAFKGDYYGEGGQDLAAAVVAALEHGDKLLACADAAAGALLEPRLEKVERAARVFDFGAMSYAQKQAGEKIERLAARRAAQKGEAEMACARVRATVSVVGAELAAGCAAQPWGTLLFVGTSRGCWLRAVKSDENAALWLLDMVRRAAAGLKQAEGTQWQKYGGKLRVPPAAGQSAAGPKPRRGRALRRVLALLALACVVALALAWYATGGDLAALPEVLGFAHELHSGAQLV